MLTWRALLGILQSMETANHTALDEEVQVIVGGEKFRLDMSESLVTGDVHFIESFSENADGEDQD